MTEEVRLFLSRIDRYYLNDTKEIRRIVQAYKFHPEELTLLERQLAKSARTRKQFIKDNS